MNSRILSIIFVCLITLSILVTLASLKNENAGAETQSIQRDSRADGTLDHIDVIAYKKDWTDDDKYDGIYVSCWLHDANDDFVYSTGDANIKIYSPSETLVFSTTVHIDDDCNIAKEIPYSEFYQKDGIYDCEVTFGGITGTGIAYVLKDSTDGKNSVCNEDTIDMSLLLPILVAIIIVVTIIGFVVFLRQPKIGYKGNPLLAVLLIDGMIAFILVERMFGPYASELCWARFSIFLITGIFVGLDATKIKAGKTARRDNITNPISWGPASWAIMVMFFGVFLVFSGAIVVYIGLILWAVIFILYIFMRRSIYMANNRGAAATDSQSHRIGDNPPGDTCVKCGGELKGPKKYCLKCNKAYNP
jgi:hypothetical protein